MKKEDKPIESDDPKTNIARKILALNEGNDIIQLHEDSDYRKQYTPYNAALLAPPGNCQQKCVYCSVDFMVEEYRNVLRKLGYDVDMDITQPWVEKVLDQLVDIGTKSVVFLGGGDWCPYEWFSDALRYAKEKDFDTGLISNLATRRFSDDEVRAIVEYADWSRGSLDGYDRESYARVRCPDSEEHFDNAVYNIKAIASERKKRNKIKGHPFGVQMVLCDENFDIIPEVLRFAESLDVDYLHIRPIELRGQFVSVDGTEDSGLQTYADVYKGGLQQLVEAGKLCDDLAKTSNIDINFRWDKVNAILKDGSFTERPVKTFKHCIGSHFSGHLTITKPVLLTHCFWRYDLAIPIDLENITLSDAFFSEERAEFFEKADNSRYKCGNLCKFSIINREWEANFHKMSDQDFRQFVENFNRRMQEGEIKIECPFGI